MCMVVMCKMYLRAFADGQADIADYRWLKLQPRSDSRVFGSTQNIATNQDAKLKPTPLTVNERGVPFLWQIPLGTSKEITTYAHPACSNTSSNECFEYRGQPFDWA